MNGVVFMQKKAFLALLLVLCLALSGCTLIQKDAAVDAATVIIQLGDQTVTKAQVQSEIDYQLNYMAYYYSMFGYSYDPTSAENIASARDTVIQNFKEDLVIHAKIAEMGLDQLTEEEEAQVKSDAEADYQRNLEYIISSNYADSELSEEEIKTKAAEDLTAMDYTMDTALENARNNLTDTKLRNDVIKDVAVTEDEVKADYDSKVEEAKADYEEDLSSYCTAFNNGTTVYYTPAGVRYVKQILLQYSEEHRTAISDANAQVTAAQSRVTAAQTMIDDAQKILDDEDATEEEKTAAQTDLDTATAELTAAQADLETAQAAVTAATDAAYASIDEEADAVLAQLKDGTAEWDALMAEKTQDPGMQEGRATAVTGYAVCEGMTGFDSAFVEAAMALENIGDISDKTRGSSNGYYIIRYESDSTADAANYDTVREGIESELLSNKQDATYDEALASWVDAADFKLNLSALDN